ncbi:hypothetical protein HNQ56_000094 [Anaerotaenia torta]|uniref:YcxB family protein n=1 Tax=Anaerotaenia torta TaxID=433293 RepID=UPI003D1AD145
MEFVFVLSEYNDVIFKSQVSKALEKRSELFSRKAYPKIWRFTDKMNAKKAAGKALKTGRIIYKIYGIFFLLFGFFLFIPSLMDPKEMRMPLIVGALAIGTGMIYLMSGRKQKKVKLTAFDKAAMQLFGGYEALPAEHQVTFTDEKIRLLEDNAIDYSEIERMFITDDLFILIWNKRITVLQKKDLTPNNVTEFINFITYKSDNLFEVVNIA